MPRPSLFARTPSAWGAPPDPDDESVDPSYSGFVLFLVRAALVLVVASLVSLVVGIATDNVRLTWLSVALAAPAVFYLVLVYAWAWVRMSLGEITYGKEKMAPGRRSHHVDGQRTRLERVLRRRSSQKVHPSGGDIALIWRLLKECRRYWPHMLGVFLIYLLATPLFLLEPIPLKIAVDSVIDNRPLPGILERILPGFLQSSGLWLLFVAALLQVTTVILSQLQSLASNILRTYAGEKMTLDLRSRMFRHVQRFSLRVHDSKGTADSVYRIQYDAPAIQYITIDGVIPLLSSAFTMVSAIYVAARIDWQISLVAMAVTPMLFMSSQRFKKTMRPHYRGVKNLESDALGVVQEVLSSVRVVKAFGREDVEQERFEKRSVEGLRARIKVAIAEGTYGMIASITVAIGTSAVLFVGVRNIEAGLLTLGQFLIVMGYIARLYQPLRSITKTVSKLQTSLASAQRAFELLDHETDVEERPHAKHLRHAIGEIEFKDVRFAYGERNEVLRGASFHIDPGMKVGIAGRTGAGKSTLVSLLMRFYDPTSGAVFLDNVDMRDYKLRDLRDQFALVLQDPVLFSTTIADNIRYGRLDATDDEVRAAARAANASRFIEASPDGYRMMVGERGMSLSGGERQRIALARAFLKNAPVLVLDEPTSSVDVATESAIMEAMERLMEGRTTLMIAHRLKTLETCDMVLLVDGGRVEIVDTDKIGERLEAADVAEGFEELDDAQTTARADNKG